MLVVPRTPWTIAAAIFLSMARWIPLSTRYAVWQKWKQTKKKQLTPGFFHWSAPVLVCSFSTSLRTLPKAIQTERYRKQKQRWDCDRHKNWRWGPSQWSPRSDLVLSFGFARLKLFERMFGMNLYEVKFSWFGLNLPLLILLLSSRGPRIPSCFLRLGPLLFSRRTSRVLGCG